MKKPHFAVEVYAPGAGTHKGYAEIDRFYTMEHAQEVLKDYMRRSPTDQFRIWKYREPFSSFFWFVIGTWVGSLIGYFLFKP